MSNLLRGVPPFPPTTDHLSLTGDLHDLPTLPDGATKIFGLEDGGDIGDFGSRRYRRYVIRGYTWFVDDSQWNGFPIEDGDVRDPDPESDAGNYIHRTGTPPNILSRINTLPTLYLNIKLTQLHRLIASEVVRAHPEIENERSAFGNILSGSNSAKNNIDQVWVWRSDLTDYNRAKGIKGSVVGEPRIIGNLDLGISRSIARRIREGRLPVNPPWVLDRFQGFWESRYKESVSLGSALTAAGERDNINNWAPLALPMLADKTVIFDNAMFDQLAEEAWIYSNQLEILKERIKQSKIDNCGDTSSLGRLRIACRFAQSARQRLRTLYGPEARDSFDSRSWIDQHGERLMAMILDFQIANPGRIFHVDHIIPLAVLPVPDIVTHGSLGWHPCNLQIISAADNVSKGSAYAGRRHVREMVDQKIQYEAADDLRKLALAYEGKKQEED
jgi:hypothetical protein